VGRRRRKGKERMRARNLSDEWWLVKAHYADAVYSIIKALGYKASETIGGGYGALDGLFFASFRFLWGDPVLSWSTLSGTALRDRVH